MQLFLLEDVDVLATAPKLDLVRVRLDQGIDAAAVAFPGNDAEVRLGVRQIVRARPERFLRDAGQVERAATRFEQLQLQVWKSRRPRSDINEQQNRDDRRTGDDHPHPPRSGRWRA